MAESLSYHAVRTANAARESVYMISLFHSLYLLYLAPTTMLHRSHKCYKYA